MMVWSACTLGVVAVLLVIAVLWINRLFEEPNAKHVASLVKYFEAQSILAIFAHADDETLAAGFLADAGKQDHVFVHSITLTKGEAGYSEPPICRKKDLVLVRESELRRYGFVLGIDQQEVWDFPDGGLASLSKPRLEELVDRLVQQIRQQKPDLVLTFDPAGGYSGHADHQATGALTSQAVAHAANSHYKPELGSPHVLTCLLYVVPPRRALQFFGDETLQKVAVAQPLPNRSMPTDKNKKLAGWQIHASQHLDRAYPFPGWLLFAFFDKEHYVALNPENIR